MNVHLELFTANICSRCVEAKRTLREIVDELSDERLSLEFIDVVEDLDYAVQTGVLATPALAMNGKLLYCPIPGRTKLKQVLKTELGK